MASLEMFRIYGVSAEGRLLFWHKSACDYWWERDEVVIESHSGKNLVRSKIPAGGRIVVELNSDRLLEEKDGASIWLKGYLFGADRSNPNKKVLDDFDRSQRR